MQSQRRRRRFNANRVRPSYGGDRRVDVGSLGDRTQHLWCRIPNNPFPLTYRCNIHFATDFNAIGAGVGGFLNLNTSWIGNSCFAHQGIGFDQLKAIYNSYRVHSCRIQVTIQNTDTALLTAVVYPSPKDTAISSVEDANATARRRQLICAPAGQANAIRTVTIAAKTCDVLSVRDISDYQTLAALVTASPSKLWYWGFVFQTADGGDISARYKVELFFDVEFFERGNLSM